MKVINYLATTVIVIEILIIITVKTRLLQDERGSSTATIGEVGFQSKQWIGCRQNHSVAYTAMAAVRGTLGPCNKRVLTVLWRVICNCKIMITFLPILDYNGADIFFVQCVFVKRDPSSGIWHYLSNSVNF